MIRIVKRECGGIFGGISFFYQIIWDIGSIEDEPGCFCSTFHILPPIGKPLIVAKLSEYSENHFYSIIVENVKIVNGPLDF